MEKLDLKKGPDAVDYGVMPLEGSWWADDHRPWRQAARRDCECPA